MHLINVKFITSCASSINWIDDDKKEIVILGKSNVGKSTFINRLTNNSSLAKTSSTPGRTRLLNFFEVNKSYRLVDAPGYGYNKASVKMDTDFATMMDEYFDNRTNLKGAILLIDSRRVPDELDQAMMNMLLEHNLPFILVATKTDKLNQKEKAAIRKNFINSLGILSDTAIICSGLNKNTWIDEVINKIDYILGLK